MNKFVLSVTAAAMATVLAAPAVQSAEVKLKSISAWPKNFPLNGDFFRFIKHANEQGKGEFHIRHIGGPEISKAPAQSKGFKSGLYDLMYTAASYHRGVVPEVDALSGTQVKPWDARKAGGMDAFDKAVTKRIDGVFLAQFATSVSFNLYLAKKPTIDANGMISLKGFKMRSVPLYDAFLKSLGATTVTVQVPEIYNALERGLVNGFAFPGMFTRKFGWAKFIKYRVYPSFYQLEPGIFMSNKALKKLSPKGRALIRKLGREWERTSYNYWKPLVAKERDILAKKYGQKEITLNAAAAKKYLKLEQIL